MKIVTMAMLEYKDDDIQDKKICSLKFLGINDAFISVLEHDWHGIENAHNTVSNEAKNTLIAKSTALERELVALNQEYKSSRKWFKKNNQKDKELLGTIEEKQFLVAEIKQELANIEANNKYDAVNLLDKARQFLVQHGFTCVSVSNGGSMLVHTEVWHYNHEN